MMEEPAVENSYSDMFDWENFQETEEETYPDAKHPKFSTFESRLKTFGKIWPSNLPKPHDLAQAGFFWFRIRNLLPDKVGVLELVRCFYCDRLLLYWELEDDPLNEHARWNPTCPFLLSIKGEEFVKEIQKQHPSQINDEIGEMINPEDAPLSTINLYPTASEFPAKRFKVYLKFSNPAYPQYRQEEARLASFEGWSKSFKQQPFALAKAGFFYEKIEGCKKDTVRCFECGEGLWCMKKEEIPWIEHARYWPKCWYLYLVKGIEFILDVRDKMRQKRLYSEEKITIVAKKSIKEEKFGNKIVGEDRSLTFNGKITLKESLAANKKDASQMESDKENRSELDFDNENPQPFNQTRTRQINAGRSTSSETFERFQTYSKYSCKAFPSYKKENERLNSFKYWPSDQTHKPADLAKAGFFFDPRKHHGYAQVCCFDCGGKLRKLTREEDPWTLHARYYPNCQFVNLTKGFKFVVDIRNKYGPKKRKRK